MTYAQPDGSQRLFDTFEQRFVALDSLIFVSSDADSATADHPAVHFQHWWIAQDSTSAADSLITNQVHRLRLQALEDCVPVHRAC